jgi:hypothetical protein
MGLWYLRAMDPVNMAYYAAVCGLLAAASPLLQGVVARVAAGAVVGLIAAAVLPWVRAWAGLG